MAVTDSISRPAPVYTPQVRCRSCGASLEDPALKLGHHYLVNYVEKRDDSLPRAPLELCRCAGCGLLQLGHSVDPELMWREYWYRSGVNATMREALRDVVRQALTFQDDGGCWLDIGANDGTLLSMVPRDFTTIACDPARNLRQHLKEHADYVVSDYFSAHAISRAQCNVITSCAMFYDVDDPNSFVSDIASTLTAEGIWINQLSETSAMLANTAFDNIVHEHRVYYDIDSLKSLYARHGLKIISCSLNDVNGGSIRTVAAKTGDSNTLGVPRVSRDDVDHFVLRVQRWRDLARQVLFDLPSLATSDVWCYGASTKGSTLLQYLDVADRFVAIADRNPKKHGLMMTGTWLPILDEAALRKASPGYVLMLPWAFHEEFTQRELALRNAGTTLIYPLPDWRFVL